MAGWPIYTHRFMTVSVPAVWVYWTVPPKTRAVIKSITVVNGGDVAADGGQLRVGAVFLLLHRPAPRTTAALSITQVAYAGDVVSGFTTGATTFMSVAGYLFDDPSGSQRAPGERGVVVPGEPLPAGALAELEWPAAG